MADFVRDFLALARQKCVLAAMLALLGGFLAVTLAATPSSEEAVSSTAAWLSWAGYIGIYLVIDTILVRSLAREAGLSGRPAWLMWLVALVVYGLLVYGGAFALQILAYIVLEDLVTSLPVEWHSGLAQLSVAWALFPVVVWQCVLLGGERSIGLSRVWKGIWSKRPYIMLIAAILYAGIGLARIGIELLLGTDLAGLPEYVAYALILLPTVVGNILTFVLAFGVVLRIRGEDVEAASFV